MSLIDYKVVDRSPCATCPNHVKKIDKRLCLDDCERLKSYQLGQDWTKKEMCIVAEGENLVDEIEDDNNFFAPDDIEDDIEDDVEDDIEDDIEDDVEDDVEGGPDVDNAEEEQIEPQKKDDPEPLFEIKKCLSCGKPESDSNKLRRGLCVSPCYGAWFNGRILHPLYGPFQKMTYEEKDTIHIDLSQYPQIIRGVRQMVGELSLPINHVLITLLAEALAKRRRE